MNTSKSRSSAAGGRGIARAALLLVPLALAACGSVVAGNGTGTGSAGAQAAQAPNKAVTAGLCADPGAVNRLVIRRTGIIMQPRQQRFTFPALVTVTSAADARAVARAVCALPMQPAGILSCPADFGIGYQLRFAAGRHHFAVVKLHAAGCEIVTGAGKPRTITHSTAFWAVLGKALRLHTPLVHRALIGFVPPGM
jgi:hypothetical protein